MGAYMLGPGSSGDLTRGRLRNPRITHFGWTAGQRQVPREPQIPNECLDHIAWPPSPANEILFSPGGGGAWGKNIKTLQTICKLGSRKCYALKYNQESPFWDKNVLKSRFISPIFILQIFFNRFWNILLIILFSNYSFRREVSYKLWIIKYCFVENVNVLL